MKFSIIILLSLNLFALNKPHIICKKGKLKRSIKVERKTSNETASCKVIYYKIVEEPWKKDILWQAKNNMNFCNVKANNLARKLRSWDWKCEQNISKNNQ